MRFQRRIQDLLKLVNADVAADGFIEIDRTVPLSFTSESVPRGHGMLWYLGDQSCNTLEFTIHEITGHLYGVTLIGSDVRIERVSEPFPALLEITEGLPIVSADAVDGNRFYEPMPFSIQRASDVITILWGRYRLAERVMRVDRGGFIFAGASLVGVCFMDLTETELAIFDEWEAARKL